jgi:hypothetical protein
MMEAILGDVPFATFTMKVNIKMKMKMKMKIQPERLSSNG